MTPVPAGQDKKPDDEELLALWESAWRVARRCCAITLERLRNGDGGFYEADDFVQDLFVEFWALVRRWRADPRSSEKALWSAWRRILWGGGLRILRRMPQRLWAGAEWAIEPERLSLADDESGEGDGDQPQRSLSPEALSVLIQGEDAEATQETLARLDALEAALWTLGPVQRQMIYMTALADLPASAVARALALGSRDTVYQRLRTARAALRCRLSGGGDSGD